MSIFNRKTLKGIAIGYVLATVLTLFDNYYRSTNPDLVNLIK